MWDDEPPKRKRSATMKRKNSAQAGTSTRDSGDPALPWGFSLPLLWGDLAFGLVHWEEECGIGIEVAGPQRAVEMTYLGECRHVSVCLTAAGQDAWELRTIPQPQGQTAL